MIYEIEGALIVLGLFIILLVEHRRPRKKTNLAKIWKAKD
jgi:hypothetical protein